MVCLLLCRNRMEGIRQSVQQGTMQSPFTSRSTSLAAPSLHTTVRACERAECGADRMSSAPYLTPTKKQEELIQRLRENLPDLVDSHREVLEDRFLMRWLKARNFDHKKAERMLRNHYQWREENNVDDILETYVAPEVFQRFEPGGFCGKDKEGYPLWIYPMGGVDTKGLLKSTTRKQCLQRRVWQAEYMLRSVLPATRASSGKDIHHAVVIMDMEHAGMKMMCKPAIELQSDISKMSEQNYPETMRRMFIVNTPSFFPVLFNMFKPLMHEETVKKIHILGTNYQETLLKYIEPEHLPGKYGGSMTDDNGDPSCSQYVNYGGKIPESLYLRPINKLTAASVPRGASLQLDFQVVEGPKLMRWEFVSEEHDIAYGVYLRRSVDQKQKDMTVVVPTERCFSHLACESGSCVLLHAGDYIFRFDNSYSWTKNKKVHYHIELAEVECSTDSTDNIDNIDDAVRAARSDSGYSDTSGMSENPRFDENTYHDHHNDISKSLENFFRSDSVEEEDFWYSPHLSSSPKLGVGSLRRSKLSLTRRIHSTQLLNYLPRSDSAESFHSALSHLSEEENE